MSNASKGPSNHFGNTRGGSQGHPTEHTNFAWAKGFNKSTLDDHFAKHGEQMGASTKDAYAAKAVSFANTVDRKHNVSFVDSKGSTHKFNSKTGEYAVITKEGVVITYFKPKEGYDYYKKQKKEKKNGK